jgi:iron complex outermembrane receptor protein
VVKLQRNTLLLTASAFVLAAATHAFAADFNISRGNLDTALNSFTQQSGVVLMVPNDAIRGVRTNGVKGQYSAEKALASILRGTGFTSNRDPSGIVAIVPAAPVSRSEEPVTRIAEAAAPARAAASVETVVVTSSKIKGDIQTVPIAITALSQEQLTSRQIAGGPDLVKEVPNLTFSKTNFTGYNIEIRGIGTQAISVTTDPAVAVAFNDIPFIRNHFFEQEFFDVSQVEVLRGPQGTLYGRNATAGVVNVVSAKPTDQFEAMLSADFGNYTNRRYEGMINIPIVDDHLGIRVAGEWTKRDGYSFNQITNKPIDGRDLWSGRVTIGWKPSENLQTYLVWEHFQEDDDRLRSGKQLCKTAAIPDSVGGVPVSNAGAGSFNSADYLSQGCLPVSLYSKEAFEVPNGYSLSYYSGLTSDDPFIRSGFDPYSETVQSTNLRDIQSSIPSIYKAKNDVVELNSDYKVTPSLTFTSQTGYSHDFLWSTEDYNRFETTPGIFVDDALGEARGVIQSDPSGLHICDIANLGSCQDLPQGSACTPSSPADGICRPAGVFCDPQLGCQDRLVVQDLNDETAWQFSQEFRLASQFSGPFNFSAGANYLHYETEENYYVFINTITQFIANNAAANYNIHYYPGVTDYSQCLPGYTYPNDNVPYSPIEGCTYVDPNPIPKVNSQGHNYFLSQNPYALNSYAFFGEVYYNITPDLKLTAGLRWTDDQKRFNDIPSELLINYYGYPSARIVDQKWEKLTGRGVLGWTPKLDFTDQTLVYASVAHGYKAGGANPPGAIFPSFLFQSATINPIHPLTFKPEYINAYEAGTKNSFLDGGLSLDGDVFYYDYKNYQISRIVDRTAINDNFNATVKGAELEANWEPAPGLKFSFAGGYEDATLNAGDHSVDLMDRTAGNPEWMVVKPYVTNASNCVLPVYVVAAMLQNNVDDLVAHACATAYNGGLDPVTGLRYVADPIVGRDISYTIPMGYLGFDPNAGGVDPRTGLPDPYTGQNTYNGVDYGPAPNGGAGFDKNLSGNQLPNAPHFTTSLAADYTIPVSESWAATLHSDFYWQSQSWARVFNDRPYDKLRGYSNVNLALILTGASGWQVMGYVKNIFNVTAITGDFLNSDDTGLTTNVFLTDPRLFGVRVTKNW